MTGRRRAAAVFVSAPSARSQNGNFSSFRLSVFEQFAVSALWDCGKSFRGYYFRVST
jgi:hypothetical protein